MICFVSVSNKFVISVSTGVLTFEIKKIKISSESIKALVCFYSIEKESIRFVAIYFCPVVKELANALISGQ